MRAVLIFSMQVNIIGAKNNLEGTLYGMSGHHLASIDRNHVIFKRSLFNKYLFIDVV